MRAFVLAVLAGAAVTAALADVPTQCAVFSFARDTSNTLWFNCGNSVARLNADGSIQVFPGAGGDVSALAFDSDGTLWFGRYGSGLFRLVNGVPEEVTFPGASVNTPAIAADHAGNIFVLANAPDLAVLRITHGALTATWPVQGVHSAISDLVVGPDGALWFTEAFPQAVGRMTMSGVFSDVAVPGNGGTFHIVAGGDGNLWASSGDHALLFRITPGGVVTGLPIAAVALATSNDRIWFTTGGGFGWIDVNSLSSQTFSRESRQFLSRPAIAALAGGDGWFAENYLPPPSPCPPADPLPGQPPPQCNPPAPANDLRIVHFATNGDVSIPLFSSAALALLAAAFAVVAIHRLGR